MPADDEVLGEVSAGIASSKSLRTAIDTTVDLHRMKNSARAKTGGSASTKAGRSCEQQTSSWTKVLNRFLQEHQGSFGVDIPEDVLKELKSKGDTDNGILGDGKVYMSTASVGEEGAEKNPIVLSADGHCCAIPFCGRAARTKHFACGHLLCRRCYAAWMESTLTRDPVFGVGTPVCPICRRPRVVNAANEQPQA